MHFQRLPNEGGCATVLGHSPRIPLLLLFSSVIHFIKLLPHVGADQEAELCFTEQHWSLYESTVCPTSFTRHYRRNQPIGFSQCTSPNRTNLNHTSASMVTRPEAGRLGNLGLIPDVEYFLVSTAIRPVLCPTQPPTQRVPRALQTRVTRPSRPVDIDRNLLSRLRIRAAVNSLDRTALWYCLTNLYLFFVLVWTRGNRANGIKR